MNETRAGGGRRQTRKATAGAQALLHGLTAAGGWVLFVYWWAKVLTFTRREDAALAFLFIFLTLMGTTILTLAWVRHNIGIFRRKGPRRRLPEVRENRDRDTLGRPIRHPGPESIRQARIVVVSVAGQDKVMEPGAGG